MAFWKELLFFLQNRGLPLSITILVFILIAIEELMEKSYKCPAAFTLRVIHISLYFFIPTLILCFLACCYQVYALKLPSRTLKDKCNIFWWAFSLALVWMVILLLDGRYVDCVFGPEEGYGTTQIEQKGSDADAYSKIIGLSLFSIIFTASGFYIKRYYKKIGELISSKEVPKWEAKGEASYLPPPEDSHSGNRKAISFQCAVTKLSPSQSTGGQDTEAEQLIPSAGVDIEMSPMQQSSPSTS